MRIQNSELRIRNKRKSQVISHKSRETSDSPLKRQMIETITAVTTGKGTSAIATIELFGKGAEAVLKKDILQGGGEKSWIWRRQDSCRLNKKGKRDNRLCNNWLRRRESLCNKLSRQSADCCGYNCLAAEGRRKTCERKKTALRNLFTRMQNNN